MNELVFLGSFIKVHRERLNLNMSQIAYKCNFSRSYISLIESGRLQKSEKFEIAIRQIFACLKLNYDDYMNDDKKIENKINSLFEYVFLNRLNKVSELLVDLESIEKTILSHKFFPRYYLCRIVSHTTLGEFEDEDMITVANILIANKDVFNIFDQMVLFTYTGILFQINMDLKKSSEYLKMALQYGDFCYITGITHYQLAITQILENRLTNAYINIQQANLRFLEEKNFNRLLLSQTQEAIILGKCQEYEKARKICIELLQNFQISEKYRTIIKVNLVQIEIMSDNLNTAMEMLATLESKDSYIIFLNLFVYYKLENKEMFISYYNKYCRNVKDIVFKQQIDILWYKNKGAISEDYFAETLLNNLLNINENYGIDLKVLVLNDLIDFYTRKGKYKYANDYLRQKLEILNR